ncbi:hypothetical protein M422DRAFT_41297 [Sphaerobolus stellatus SS14]|nr:hypothetical protein M422DRAFT_41297 [Sphaerobolus stellatus SS14]
MKNILVFAIATLILYTGDTLAQGLPLPFSTVSTVGGSSPASPSAGDPSTTPPSETTTTGGIPIIPTPPITTAPGPISPLHDPDHRHQHDYRHDEHDAEFNNNHNDGYNTERNDGHNTERDYGHDCEYHSFNQYDGFGHHDWIWQ